MRLRTLKRHSLLSPERSVVGAFLATVIIGAFLLALPISNTDGAWHLSSDSLFLSTSATCVTGLDPVGVGTALTNFGLVVLVILAEIGGVGIMTIGTFFFIAMGKRLSVSEERIVMNTLGENSVGGISRIILSTLFFTLTWEILGTILLAWRLHVAHGYSPHHALAQGVFLSVMAFCNAGFTITADSLCLFATDRILMITMLTLILVGGIGFIVHGNLIALRPWRNKRRNRGRLTLHSYIVLTTTAIILAIGTVGYLVFEWAGALGAFSGIDKVIGALFQTVTSRTAGFAAIPTSSLRDVSVVLTTVIMFIGAAPGSTGGGIKITTAAILFATIRDIVLNRQTTEIRNRSLPTRVVKDAIAITVLSLVVITGATFVIAVTEESTGVPMFRLFFEVVSAFATTGLSLDTTPTLTIGGRLCIIVCMFIGRLGPATLAMSMSQNTSGPAKRFPEENVIVG
mgnify:CR=1 FL=1